LDSTLQHAEEAPQKRNKLLNPRRGTCPLRELSEPDNLARFNHTQAKVHSVLVSPPDQFPVLSNR